MDKSTAIIGALYFVILRIFWMFRSIYDTIIPGNNNLNPNEASRGNLRKLSDPEPTKRHLIHLFSKNSTEKNGRPICYIKVCELVSAEEEMLRCVCAKGFSNQTSHARCQSRSLIPSISWMESFSTLAA